MKKRDYYSVLGVSRDASAEEIRHAFFLAARHYHPDINVSPGDTEYFLSATEAYEILSDEMKRSQYDAGLSPEEAINNSLDYVISLSQPHLTPINEPQLIYAILKLRNPKSDETNNNTLPINLCLLIDISSSMGGIKLDHAKSAAVQIVRRLRSQDTFSLIVFNDRAEILAGFSNQEEAPRIETKIHMIQSSGGTEIYNGLQTAFSEISRGIDKDAISHIILLTDGHTYGDEQKCMDLASRAADQGIIISGFGIGSDWNDSFIDDLTSRTGGSSFFISNSRNIQDLLLNKLDQIYQMRTRNISLNYIEQENSKLMDAFRLMPEPGSLLLNNPLILGSPSGSDDLSILLEFIVKIPAGFTEVDLLNGHISYQTPANNQMTNNMDIRICLPVQPSSDKPGKTPREIVKAVSELTFFRMQNRARSEVSSGKIEQAIKHLQRVATHVLQKGNGDLYKLIQSEVDSIRSTQAFSAEGEKNIKYGTRSLFSNSSGVNHE